MDRLTRRHFFSALSSVPFVVPDPPAAPSWPQWSGWASPPGQIVQFGFWWAPSNEHEMHTATSGGVADILPLVGVVPTWHVPDWPVPYRGDDLDAIKARARELFRQTWGY